MMNKTGTHMRIEKQIKNPGIARIFKEFEKLNDRLQNGLTPVSVATLKEYIISLEGKDGK